MPSLTTPDGFSYAVSVTGQEFAFSSHGIAAKSHLLAETSWPLQVQVSCFKKHENQDPPELLIELYVDGVLRNVATPRTGRGLAYLEFASCLIDHGVVMTDDGRYMMKQFHFENIDIDNAILSNRLVPNAGQIEIRIVSSTIEADGSNPIQFELPCRPKDHGAVTLLDDELNNTCGVRFFGASTMKVTDVKEKEINKAMKMMVDCVKEPGRKLLASFTFVYGTADLLNHLGAIPHGHKLFDYEHFHRKSFPLGSMLSYRARRGCFYIARPETFLRHEFLPSVKMTKGSNEKGLKALESAVKGSESKSAANYPRTPAAGGRRIKGCTSAKARRSAQKLHLPSTPKKLGLLTPPGSGRIGVGPFASQPKDTIIVATPTRKQKADVAFTENYGFETPPERRPSGVSSFANDFEDPIVVMATNVRDRNTPFDTTCRD